MDQFGTIWIYLELFGPKVTWQATGSRDSDSSDSDSSDSDSCDSDSSDSDILKMSPS